MTPTPPLEGEMTPGPWEVSEAKTADGTFMIVGGEGFGFGLIADVTTEADARAISALPDLVEALREMLDGVEDQGGDPDGVVLLPLYNRELTKALKALSLLSAGGGSSVARAEVAASSGVKSDKLEGH